VTFSKTKKITIAFVAVMAFAAAQATPPAAAPAAPADTRKWKNADEETLGIAANNEKDPAARLEKLDKWKHDFPQSDYDEARTGVYFAVYGDLKRYHDQIMAAQELRKKVPDNLLLLRTIFGDALQIKPPGADDLAAVADAARYIIDHPDEVFSPKNKPADQTDDQWNQLKPVMVAYAEDQLDWVAEQQSEAQKSFDPVIARLKQNPTRINLNVWLGGQYVKQGAGDPTKIVLALFHYARVAQYDGPGAAPAATKAGAKKYFDKQYAGYHGSAEGADQVLAIAKANSTPPPGFDIESITSISGKKIKEDEEKRKANPMITLWTDTKTAIMTDPAAMDAVKGSEMPGTATPGVTKFKGKIVSMTPAIGRPKKLVLAVEKDGVADCTLIMDAPLPGKMDAGSEVEFSGVVKEVSKEPYMLTFEVEKANLVGWTGKNAPGPARPPKK
jgi:hypothetical protein